MAVGLWIRVSIEETPVFQAEQEAARERAARGDSGPRPLPVLEAVRYQWREMVLGGIAFTSLFAFFYIGTSFLTSYASSAMELPRNEVLMAGLIASVFFAGATLLSGRLSDRIGRKRSLLLAGAVAVPWSLAMFPVLDAGAPSGNGLVLFTVGVAGTLMIAGFMFGPAGSFLPELFHTRYRYTGAGMAYSLAGILGGALPPLAAVGLAGTFGGGAVGIMLAAIAVLSFVMTLLLRETRGSDLSDERGR